MFKIKLIKKELGSVVVDHCVVDKNPPKSTLTVEICCIRFDQKSYSMYRGI